MLEYALPPSHTLGDKGSGKRSKRCTHTMWCARVPDGSVAATAVGEGQRIQDTMGNVPQKKDQGLDWSSTRSKPVKVKS